MVKNLPAIQETWVLFLDWEDPLTNKMAIHSSILFWRIPWREESGGLQSMGSKRVRHDWATNTFISGGAQKNMKKVRVYMLLLLSHFSHVRLSATPWAIAHQIPLSMEFSRQEYWSGLPFSSPGNLPNPGIEPVSPALQEDSLLFEPPGKPIIINTLKLFLMVYCRHIEI